MPDRLGRLGGIGRSCSARARARLADRHFTSRREGGGSRGDGFLQGKETRPRGEGAEAQISCRRGLAGGGGRERGLPPIKGPPQRSFPDVRCTSPRALLLRLSAGCAPGLSEIYSRSALRSFAGSRQSQGTGMPSAVFFSRPFPSLSAWYILPRFAPPVNRLRPGRARVHVRTCQQLVISLRLSLPQRHVGLTAFLRNFRPKRKADESTQCYSLTGCAGFYPPKA